MKVTVNGRLVDYDAAVYLMDDKIREDLSSAQDWDSEQAFIDAYCSKHQSQLGEEFKAD